MRLIVEPITKESVYGYIERQPAVGLPEWELAVLDQTTVKAMLSNGNYARERKAFGLLKDQNIIGYAVVHEPTKTLDLLHLSDVYRGLGFGESFLNQLDITDVSVDSRNKKAIKLYDRLKYTIDFI